MNQLPDDRLATVPQPPSGRWGGLRRLAPAAALAAIAAAAYWAGLPEQLSPARLVRHASELRAAVHAAPALAVGLYVLVYAGLTAACLPVALMLTLAGGLIFGAWVGGAATVVGASSGAVLTYLAARAAFAPSLLVRAERDRRLQRIMQGFGRDAFSYILTARLIPLFPFSLVNIAAGLAAVPLRAYALATVAGAVPTSFIYSSLGSGLGFSLRSQQSLAQVVRQPGVLGPLAALAVLSLAPTLVKRLRRGQGFAG